MRTLVKFVIGYAALHGAIDIAKRASFGAKSNGRLRGLSWQEIDNEYHRSQIL